MKIILAKHAGFCFGVKRAVDLALKTSEESNDIVYTLGPLIHNDAAVDMLKQKSIVAINDMSIVNGHKLIIRSHGVGKHIYDDVNSKGIELIAFGSDLCGSLVSAAVVPTSSIPTNANMAI